MGNLAEQYEENEQYDLAYEEYKKQYSQRPKNIEVLERLGHLAGILHKSDEAIEYYNKILELDKTSTLAYEQLMDLYMHTDRYKYYIARGNLHIVEQQLSHAVTDFKKALGQTQDSAEINTCHFMMATLFEQLNKPHQAIDEYLRILDSSLSNEIVYLKLARIYESQDAAASAVDILNRGISAGYDSEAVKEYLAQLYLKIGQPSLAKDLTNDDMVKVRSLLDEEKNAEAFSILEAVQDAKKDAKYYSLLAQYYYNVQNWEESLAAVAQYAQKEINSALTYQMRALIYEQTGDDFSSHYNWGRYNVIRGNLDVALNEFLTSHSLNLQDVDLINELAVLLEDMGDKNHSVEFYEKLLNLDSSNKKAAMKVAEFRESIGDYRSAGDAYEKLLASDPRNFQLMKKTAEIFEKLKNKEKALYYYKKFISTSPVNSEYEAVVLKISKLENTDMEPDEGLLGKLMNLFAKK